MDTTILSKGPVMTKVLLLSLLHASVFFVPISCMENSYNIDKVLNQQKKNLQNLALDSVKVEKINEVVLDE